MFKIEVRMIEDAAKAGLWYIECETRDGADAADSLKQLVEYESVTVLVGVRKEYRLTYYTCDAVAKD